MPFKHPKLRTDRYHAVDMNLSTNLLEEYKWRVTSLCGIKQREKAPYMVWDNLENFALNNEDNKYLHRCKTCLNHPKMAMTLLASLK